MIRPQEDSRMAVVSEAITKTTFFLFLEKVGINGDPDTVNKDLIKTIEKYIAEMKETGEYRGQTLSDEDKEVIKTYEEILANNK